MNDAYKSNFLLGQNKIKALAKACLHLLQFPGHKDERPINHNIKTIRLWKMRSLLSLLNISELSELGRCSVLTAID